MFLIDLLMSVSTVVKNRSGTVLSRGMILKSDHFDTGVNPKSDIKLQGAPNFRMADINVCGVAQPTTSGIKTVLTLLRVQPGSSHTSKVLWISAREEPLIYIDERPFVIRDSTKALKHLDIYQGIRTHRLEQMEERLKRDIILERDRWAGLILVHDEPSDLTLVPEWVAVTKVQTPREVFAELSAEGFSVIYDRIPISPEEAPRDIQMDSFIKAVKGHPTMAPIVFNCGMGLGRTTCAMVIAIIIRRFKILQEQGTDHLKIFSRLNKPYNDENISMVELLQVLDQAFASSSMDRSAIDWALARSPVLSNLRESMNGKYRIVGQLGSLLGNGTELKELLDEAIDRCSLFVNLRKLILAHRLKHSVSGDESVLKRAVGCLERYLAVFALCSYLQETHEGKTNAVFSDWLISKPDVFNLLNRLSDTTASLSLFQPCDNISIFSSDIQARGLTAWGPHTDQPASELDKYVIKARKGAVLSQNTILKEDFWEQGTKITGEILSLKGASNFRQIPGYPVYGVAQPTLQGVKNVLEHIRHVENIVWINLREEPFIYINSVPYVLRDMDVTLRNLKSFRGITPQGLRTIESKLKKDVLDELKVYGEKILLHSETEGGKVTPVWQECCPSAVLSLNDAMKLIKMEMEVNETHMSMPSLYENVVELTYHRVPLTAEAAPDAEDFDHMIEILKTIRLENFAVVLNCQIGHGRSTTGTVMTILILRWLGMKLDVVPMLAKKNLTDRATNNFNYQATHSLLRVIRNGIECKHIVDQVIDCAATIINIRDSIEFFRQKRDKEPAGQRRDYYHARGVVSLERYFNLILFQNYLNNNEYSLGNDMISFKSWILQHPEFETIKEESLFNENFDPLVPVSELEPGDGIALTDEVLDAVNRRRGAVLSQGTIIKYDVFPGCQKQSLPDRIDGSPNYRLVTISNIMNIPKDPLAPDVVQSGKVCGVGMPSKAGIMSVLKHLNAGPQGESFAYWTSLREEPVLYIKGRPYVLRLFIDPIKVICFDVEPCHYRNQCCTS